MSKRTINVLVLSAGKGTRMGSNKPKVLHTIGRRSMLCHVLTNIKTLSEEYTVAETLIIHSPSQKQVFQDEIAHELSSELNKIGFCEQTDQLGTGHAVQCGTEAFKNPHPVLVLFGDQPLMQPDGLAAMIDSLTKNSLCIATFIPDDPLGLGRVIQDTSGNVQAIVEEKDATSAQKAIRLCNAGVMGISQAALPLLNDLSIDNAAGEYYLTDMVVLAGKAGLSVQHHVFPYSQMAAVNTLAELAAAEKIWQQNARKEHMRQGVQMLAPETVYFSVDTKIAANTVIEPHVVFGRGVQIAERTRILSFSHFENCVIGADCQIGPFTRIRPESTVEDDVRIGNFVEIKNAHLHTRTRAGHLSYLGDCQIDENVNIGAGTITCNYDGYTKSHTRIGKNSFIGSNSSLVAPLSVGKDSIVGAGSVINTDVPNDALTMERNRQVIVRDGAKRLRKRRVQKKESKESQ